MRSFAMASSLIHQAGFDGIEESAEPLVGFCDSPGCSSAKMLAAALGAFLASVEESW